MPSVRWAQSRGRRPAEARPWRGSQRSLRPTAFKLRNSHRAPARKPPAAGAQGRIPAGEAVPARQGSAAAPLASAREVPAAPPPANRGNRSVPLDIPTCPLGDNPPPVVTPHTKQSDPAEGSNFPSQRLWLGVLRWIADTSKPL